MKGKQMNVVSGIVIPLLLGVLAVWIILGVLTGRQVPLISGPRPALIALLVVGMTMCAAGGIGQVGASGRWASPLAILGYLLGAAILVVVAGVFLSWKLPWIEDENQAVAAVGVMMAFKYLIGTAGFFLHWL